jgi:hypothetical protein
MATPRQLTNVVVAHEGALLGEIETNCPFQVCEVKAVDLSSTDLQSPWNSNQIAEARQYFVVDPKELTTPFVSFSSYRLPKKKHSVELATTICVAWFRTLQQTMFTRPMPSRTLW